MKLRQIVHCWYYEMSDQLFRVSDIQHIEKIGGEGLDNYNTAILFSCRLLN
jgi:hypothetical protein